MAEVLHSFTELAKVFKGNEVKAKKVVALATYNTILDKCGSKAATIWGFMQEREACRKYGPKGFIMHDLDSLMLVTGYDQGQVIGAVVALIRNGFARPTVNGNQIKAA
jgi:hypothetical protein